jgi:hypothetical protein
VRTFLVPNTSTSLQTALAAAAHLAEGQFLVIIIIINQFYLRLNSDYMKKKGPEDDRTALKMSLFT